MASRTMLDEMTANLRRQHDNALKVSGILRAYNNVTLYRYSIVETDMKDETKTLLETIENVTIYLDYPGDISNLSNNNLFVEDNLPIMVMFPWFRECGKILKVDIKDEFEITLKTEFDEDKLNRYEITDRHSIFEENHLERSFICAPKRTSSINLTDQVDNTTGDPTPDGLSDDPNYDLDGGSNDPVNTGKVDIYSEYD